MAALPLPSRHLHSNPIVDFVNLLATSQLHRVDNSTCLPFPFAVAAVPQIGSSTSIAEDTTKTQSSCSSPCVSRTSASTTRTSGHHQLLYHIQTWHDMIKTGKPTDGETSSIAMTNTTMNRSGVPFYIPPASCTHPLSNKPQPRDEHCQRLEAAVSQPMGKSSTESLIAAARSKAKMITSALTQPSRLPATRSGGSDVGLAIPGQAYTKGLRDRERLALEVAAEPRYLQEWGFFLKCYSEVS